MTEENKFQNSFIKALEAYGCYAVANVQSAYQMGQPDMRVWTKSGFVIDIENKVMRSGNVTVENIIKLLRPTQKAVILHRLWPRNAACLIVAQFLINVEFAAVVYKTNLESVRWKTLACSIANVKSHEEFLLLTNPRKDSTNGN